ncbi:dipeptidase [Nakamurella endophytica]|uniref:Dipeptidase n=1 Tax=Nakamurella endophytica TaxID=1748367 RepID=A0A917T017_9ACTN|nr:dipeptidase [Nakamurella endophytica]GGM04419.1 dipeptidase [Nakamurella endophytica]
MTAPQPTDVAAVHAQAPVFDGHNDVAWALRKQVRYDLDRRDLAVDQPSLHTDIPRLRRGGVGAQFFSVYVPGTLPPGDAVVATLEQIDCVAAVVARYPDTFRACRTAADVRAAMADRRIAALMGAEGGHSIAGSLAVLRTLHRLGVGYLTLTHNQNVPWADAATDVPAAGGLTAFGREVVAEMNRLGMLVDLSHVAESTMNDALDASRAPVIFSHSSCRALAGHVRDVPDAVLGRLPGNGGVVMLTFVPQFVSRECARYDAELEAVRERLDLRTVGGYTADAGEEPTAEAADPAAAAARVAATAELERWQREHPAPVATLAQVADHVEHAREVAGVDHLGLGGDYDGVDRLPQGLADVSCYPALLTELATRGWSAADLRALTSGNILRVMADAEAVAASL